MKKHYKRFVLVCISLVFGIGIVVIFFPSVKSSDFKLVRFVDESDVIIHTSGKDLNNLLTSLTASDSIAKQIGARNDLLQSLWVNTALNLQNLFITYSFSTQNVKVYVEIKNDAAFEVMQHKMVSKYHFELWKGEKSVLVNRQKKIRMIKHPNYVVFIRTNNLDDIPQLPNSTIRPFFQKTIAKNGTGIVNLMGESGLDSACYGKLLFSFTPAFQLKAKLHFKFTLPKLNQRDTIFLYNTDTLHSFGYINLNKKNSKKLLPPSIKENLDKHAAKNTSFIYQFLRNFDGQFSFNKGRKGARKKIYFTTQMDENFNLSRKKHVSIDSMLEIGYYFSTNDPKALAELLVKTFKNTKRDTSSYELNIRTKKGGLFIHSIDLGFKKLSSPYLVDIAMEEKGFTNRMRVKQKDNHTIIVDLSIKNPLFWYFKIKDFY